MAEPTICHISRSPLYRSQPLQNKAFTEKLLRIDIIAVLDVKVLFGFPSRAAAHVKSSIEPAFPDRSAAKLTHASLRAGSGETKACGV